jgi:SAM-dependent methyltransferase
MEIVRVLSMDEYMKANKELWDRLAKVHEGSEFYDVKGFLAGKQTLDPIEQEELTDLKGRTLLHLMCHIGLDTLSLARRGAIVTGVDFSEDAVEIARNISRASGIDGTFVCSNIYDLPDNLDGTYDIVFTSGGVLVWLPDLDKWAQVIDHFLKPGGSFYIREFHPYSYIFDDEGDISELKVRYPYFQGEKPLEFEDEGSYADPEAKTGKMKSYEWNHPISRIINALTGVGLRIEFFNEYAETSYQALPFMVKREDGRYVIPGEGNSIPLMFSLKASKSL